MNGKRKRRKKVVVNKIWDIQKFDDNLNRALEKRGLRMSWREHRSTELEQETDYADDNGD